MKKRAWYLYPALAAVATTAYLAVRTGPAPDFTHPSWAFNLIGLSSPLFILLAVRIHKPDYRIPWFLFAAGQFLFICGDVVAYNYDRFHSLLPSIFTFQDGGMPFPSPADVLYLSVYPCLIAGLLLLLRRRSPGRDTASFIDSLMVAIGVGTLSWVFLISPYVHDSSMTGLSKLVSMGYPVMDLLMAAVAVRLAVGAGRRASSFNLIMLSIVALFATDAIYGWLLLNNGYVPGSGDLELGWVAFYVLFGAAALHPSMRTLSDQVGDAKTKLTQGRLGLLAGATLLAPAAQAIQSLRDLPVDLPVVLGATVVLFALAIVRMAGLVHKEEQSTLREKALREAGAALVTATNREGIYEAALEATRSLAGLNAAVRVCVVKDEGDTLVVVASAGGSRDTVGETFDFSSLAAWKREKLLGHGSYQVPASESSMQDELDPSTLGGMLSVAPLFIRDEFRGMILVAAGAETDSRAITDGLEALASQVALALESAALTEGMLLQESEKRFASLVQNSSDIVNLIEPDTTVRYASPATARVLGMQPDQMEGTKFSAIVHPEDKTRVLTFLTSMGEEGATGLIEYRIKHNDGHWIFVETLRTNLLHDPNVKGIVANTRDITERKAFEEQLSHQAFHDPITNLANRALFRDRVTHALERQGRDGKPIAVVFMDLDDFKTVNDSLGHAAGDQMLAEVGDRLRNCLRAADTAARLGGDEFAILLEDGGDGIQAADVADRIMQALEAPFQLEGKEVFGRASIGIAVVEGDNVTQGQEGVEEVLRNADVAMYMAKENGKGRYQIFETAMHDTALKRLELKGDLQRALEHDEFILNYQPVIELETGRILGVEALIRWIHPERGLVPPLDFIPLAEETGLIIAIGRWVLREACTKAVELQNQFPSDPKFHMAVNLSARQLQRPEIVEEVRSILEETGLDADSLVLEITESVMMADMELSIARLTELKDLGVKLAVDDFGTGYSSLNYIRRFPVDILKVDKSFVDGVNEGGEASALTAAVIELAGILNLKPVAEGIERADQLERLLEMKCDLGQGYFFAKPLALGDLRDLLSERLVMHAEAETLAQQHRK